MSDIAKKTLPPGARGKPAPSKPTETSSDPSAPRSAPSAPQKLPADDDAATVSSDNFSRSGACEEDHDHGDHYTHASEKVPDIPEENEGEAPQDDEQEPIKMQDQDKTEDLEDVEPKPVDDEEQETEKISDKKSQTQDRLVNGDVPSEAPEQKEDATEGASTPAPSGRESAQSGVTEEAKRAFDEASENQPTSQAGIPAEQSEAATEKQIPEGQNVSKDISDKAPSEAQEPAETATEKAPTVTEQAPTEKAPTELGEQQEQVPSEQGTAIQDQAPETVASPSQIGADEGGAPTEQGSQFPAEGTVQEPEQSVQEESGVPEGSQAAPSETVAEQLDFSVLKGGRVNKGGNIVTDEGRVVGRVTQGILQYLVGKRVDENGAIWSDSGKVIGQAEPISDSERDDMLKESAPFESFPDATVDGNGMVVSNGEWVGKVVEGDVSRLRGKSVDADGDILDKGGNVIGRAERWEPEPEAEAEPEPEVDKSALAGKRVNKAGNVVDGSGVIWGRIVEGDVKRMIGRMCDKNGNVLSESGDILGKAELVSEGEREGLKEGPFAELQGCTVAKDGTVVTPSGDIVGRLTSGDGKVLFGRAVDEDGDVLDRNGNVIGKAERWEPEVVERKKHPMCGRRVNREGNVVDEDGNLIGKLTSGDPRICSGKEIDNDGDVVDSKGTVIGHCTLIEEIQEEETESPEDKEKREQQEQNKKLAIQMTTCIEQCLERIRPICKMITEKIDKAERTPEDQRAEDHEDQLVKEVRPLIEEGGHILTEAKGIIKGLDPDGRIAANAKHKTAAREATPEEYRLADVLKDLTGDVTQCIENSKRKLEDLPRAKKELNPLWGLLNEPLFQILAAVGLLLSGVLNLVGRLLSGLGLGGLVDGLLGTLGINRVLGALGLGSFSKSLKSGKKGGGLLGGVLGG